MFLLNVGVAYIYAKDGKPVFVTNKDKTYLSKEDIVIDPIGKLGRPLSSSSDIDKRLCREGYYGFRLDCGKEIFVHANDIEYLD